ncbi:pyocin activator PrtN family protein [Paracoccus shandongensis]|uniref:pyocin activator PrtN family protein n=1 Tax=Paracoccus shandongensis TaxID=2816048 RepID=UPI001A8FB960|nr:pyocin activator PrtN family protein [Paracoccus shandongensis]
MDTLWMLTGRYQGLPLIPVDRVVEDFFPHLNRTNFLRKVTDGHIALPLVNVEASQKSAKAIHLAVLASYLDARHEVARREFEQFHA